MAYRNYMEDVVIEELEGVLKQIKGLYKCEKCREDIAAYALNRLPAEYVATMLGTVYTSFNQMKIQARVDVNVKLAEAVKLVKKKPRH